VLRDSDTLARLGGDEFVALLPPPADLVSALVTGRKVLDALEPPIVVGDVVVRTSATIGIALFPAHAHTAETLIDRADAAMYAARRARSSLAAYDPENHVRTASTLAQLEQLAAGIGAGELQLEFQPTVRLSDMRALRAEALVRWNHGSRGRMQPAAFIKMADRAGLGRALTTWVLAHALERCSKWREEGFSAGVSINLSLTDLLDPELPQRIREGLLSTGVEARALSLDVSERSLRGDPAQLERRLRALAQTGVRLALDDFGSGTASLRLLQRLPFSEVKLDGRFVAEICTNIESWSFVRSGIDAAHDLGLEVTAEGVEDKATAYVLARLGCDVAQGRYFTRSGHVALAFLSAAELDTSVLN
jgi:predicted signal transduction protein with EAL and GGDEF domain